MALLRFPTISFDEKIFYHQDTKYTKVHKETPVLLFFVHLGALGVLVVRLFSSFDRHD